jgi:hypothetical protein
MYLYTESFLKVVLQTLSHLSKVTKTNLTSTFGVKTYARHTVYTVYGGPGMRKACSSFKVKFSAKLIGS